MVAVLLVAAILASYANSFQCPFLYDDWYDITKQPGDPPPVASWDVFLVRFRGWRELHSRPVVNLSFALDYAIGGLSTLPIT